MKNLIVVLVVGLSVISVGCQSEHKLTKPTGKWVAVNQVEKPVTQSTNSSSDSK